MNSPKMKDNSFSGKKIIISSRNADVLRKKSPSPQNLNNGKDQISFKKKIILKVSPPRQTKELKENNQEEIFQKKSEERKIIDYATVLPSVDCKTQKRNLPLFTTIELGENIHSNAKNFNNPYLFAIAEKQKVIKEKIIQEQQFKKESKDNIIKIAELNKENELYKKQYDDQKAIIRELRKQKEDHIIKIAGLNKQQENLNEKLLIEIRKKKKYKVELKSEKKKEKMRMENEKMIMPICHLCQKKEEEGSKKEEDENQKNSKNVIEDLQTKINIYEKYLCDNNLDFNAIIKQENINNKDMNKQKKQDKKEDENKLKNEDENNDNYEDKKENENKDNYEDKKEDENKLKNEDENNDNYEDKKEDEHKLKNEDENNDNYEDKKENEKEKKKEDYEDRKEDKKENEKDEKKEDYEEKKEDQKENEKEKKKEDYEEKKEDNNQNEKENKNENENKIIHDELSNENKLFIRIIINAFKAASVSSTTLINQINKIPIKNLTQEQIIKEYTVIFAQRLRLIFENDIQIINTFLLCLYKTQPNNFKERLCDILAFIFNYTEQDEIEMEAILIDELQKSKEYLLEHDKENLISFTEMLTMINESNLNYMDDVHIEFLLYMMKRETIGNTPITMLDYSIIRELLKKGDPIKASEIHETSPKKIDDPPKTNAVNHTKPKDYSKFGQKIQNIITDIKPKAPSELAAFFPLMELLNTTCKSISSMKMTDLFDYDVKSLKTQNKEQII